MDRMSTFRRRARTYSRRVQNGKPPSVGQGQGTSFAVALTAGVAACWLAHHGRPNLIAEARARGETLQNMFRRILRATARRPPGWNGINMGAGIVHARRLLEADFDAGRDHETAAPVARREAPALGVRRFVAEAVTPEAGLQDLDWKLYGPEIALTISRTISARSRAPEEPHAKRQWPAEWPLSCHRP